MSPGEGGGIRSVIIVTGGSQAFPGLNGILLPHQHPFVHCDWPMGRTKDSKRCLQLSINMSETSAPARLQATYQEAGTMPNGVLSQGRASGLARTPAKLCGNPWARGNSTTLIRRSYLA